MNSQTTNLPGLAVTTTAHEGPEGRLLMARLLAEDPRARQAPPARVAVVIDRSGSMSGQKLQIAKRAVAQLVRSLRPEDRIGVVTYDDSVDLVSPMAAPSEELARSVERIRAGGSTDLYGGWVKGARLVGPGGRVILLSDGLANVGRYTDAHDLKRHAGISYEKFRVTTSTIGVGEDYDEALMAGMARAGAGAHYYAHSAEAIAEAFSQERLAIGSVALSHVSLRYQGTTIKLGQLWGGESKRAVMRVPSLGADPATIRYTVLATGETLTLPLDMPRSFGHSDDATLELILEDAASVETTASEVRDPRMARDVRASVRAVLLRLLAHPLADGELASAVRSSLERTMDRLERLERHFDEREAAMHRKRSAQSSHNVRERGKAFSSFEEDQALMESLNVVALCETAPMRSSLEADLHALSLLPMERWRSWPALPLGLRGDVLEVAVENPKDGFLLSEIERETGRRVSPHRRSVDAARIHRLLDEAEGAL